MSRYHSKHRLPRLVVSALVLVALGSTASTAMGQVPRDTPLASSTLASPSSDEIVQRLVEHNEHRAEQLKSYVDQRHYTVTYHGFPAALTADMVVEATYDAPSTKHFRILSETGSKLLVDRVLKKLVESEKEAAQDPGKTALTPANYTFTLLGQQRVMGRRCYAFHVEPKVDSKFRYRGKVYIDAEDYAVIQIEAEPAKKLSFWIKKTEIHHVYAKTGKFWLPERDRSETTVRLGGTAVLTIEYGVYSVQPVATH